MNNSSVAFLLTCVALPLVAIDVAGAARTETRIEESMEKMNGAFRKLRRQINDASQNASSLELLAAIRKEALESEKHVPLRAAQIAADKRAAWVAAYQARIRDFAGLVARVETEVKAGRNGEAVRLVNQMGDAQKAGHKEFRQPDQKGGK